MLGTCVASKQLLQRRIAAQAGVDLDEAVRARQHGDPGVRLERTRSITLSLVGLAAVVCAVSEYVQAVRLLGAVAALLSASNQVLEPMDRSDYDRSTAVARAHLDAVTFDQAWAAGQALPLEQASAEACALAAA